ncbi:sensor histidine kinase [Streptomyces sp. NPDC051561]|uniref:sensor histidine kinase n=1 Tax=Streptomyces sp. NPDC051561 TaxID=3365658 RepID=UPI0037B1F5FC
MALVAVVAVVVGAVTSVALQSYLERQVDDQLNASVERDHGWGMEFVAAPGNPLKAVGVRNGAGVTSVDVKEESAAAGGARYKAQLKQLDAAQVKALEAVPRDGKPHTVSVPGLGDYRVLAGTGSGGGGPGGFPGVGPGAGRVLGYVDGADSGVDSGSGSGVGSDSGSGKGSSSGSGTEAGSGNEADSGSGSGSDGSAEGRTVVLGFPLEGVQGTVHTLVVVVVCVTLAALVAAGLAGHALVGAALRPLRRIAATATRVSELPLDRGEVALHERVPQAQADSRTEVGQVGAALNRMLGHVGSALTARQESEMRVRRFVADASHELRTPLASIRGYAELTRRGREAAATGPDTRHALGRIESEATRMTGLVEDLLLLARLDAGAEGVAGKPGADSHSDSGSDSGCDSGCDSGSGSGLAKSPGTPLSWESTDLLPLVVDAVSDARAAGQEHLWRLELPDEPVLVRGDPARLQQVLVNLLGNARTHTPPGTRVTACVRTEEAGREVVVEVRDDGPGIAPELVGRVFERFARGDVSRTRAGATVGGGGSAAASGMPVASTGLGLAIVRAVVGAHGGTVGVESEPGRTVFSVRLPADVREGAGADVADGAVPVGRR